MAVVGAAFLLAVDRASVESMSEQPARSCLEVCLGKQLSVHRAPADSPRSPASRPNLWSVEAGCTAIPVPLRADQAKRRISG